MKQRDQHRSPRGRRHPARPDLDLAAVAERVGISPGYLSQILRGTRQPSFPITQKLAPELGVPLDRLPKELEWYRRQSKPRRRRG